VINVCSKENPDYKNKSLKNHHSAKKRFMENKKIPQQSISNSWTAEG